MKQVLKDSLHLLVWIAVLGMIFSALEMWR